ncbi:basic proline-rich protein-like [Iris pallida]|uniref:Basic proline-rich protein-like n=1 Tax=Iris pallida TaxID=29817 RepID=A0AAX6FJX4_IRIPA|nr:basic proline-rich protein-like [Iris pallida]
MAKLDHPGRPWPETRPSSISSSPSSFSQTKPSPPPSFPPPPHFRRHWPRMAAPPSTPRRVVAAPSPADHALPSSSPCPAGAALVQPRTAAHECNHGRTSTHVHGATAGATAAVDAVVMTPPCRANSGDPPWVSVFSSSATYRRLVRFARRPVVTHAK